MVNKLNINMKSFNKKGYKLKKALAIFGLTTGVVFSLASCGKKNDFHFNEPNRVTTKYENSTSSDVIIKEESNIGTNANNNPNINNIYQAPEIEYSKLDFNKIIYLSDANTAFQNYLSKLNIKYDYSELFNTEKALVLYEKENDEKVTHSHDFLKGGTSVDVEQLYDVVVANNKEYLKNNKATLYKNFDKKDLMKILNIVADTINSYISLHSDIDLESLSCTLGDLKVFQKTSTVNAYVSSDGVLAINPPMLNIIIRRYESMGIDAYKNTIMHETIHLIQRMCEDTRKQEPSKYMGISRKYDSLDVNPLVFNWLYESAAEKNVVNLTGDIPIVYSTMITYLDSLNLTNFLNDKNSIKSTESLDSYKELDGLFKMFGATTKEEKIELINMMVSINIIQVEPEDFIKKYNQIYGENFNDNEVLTKVKCTIKAEVMQTLSKYFYKNLANKIVNKEIAMEDIFYLITIFENDINLHIKYTDSKYNSYNENFIDYYVKLQNEFFYSLSLNGKYTFEQIVEKFNEYNTQAYGQNNELQDNYLLDWLEHEKREYSIKYYSNIASNNHEIIRKNFKRVYEGSKQFTR